MHQEAEVFPHQQKGELGEAHSIVLNNPPVQEQQAETSYSLQQQNKSTKHQITYNMEKKPKKQTTHIPKWLRNAAMYSLLLW